MTERYYTTFWLLILMTFTCVLTDCSNKRECKCTGFQLECYHTMPDTIPSFITEVIAYETPLGDVFNFSDPGWVNITYLSINPGSSSFANEEEPHRILRENEFIALKNLRYLQIACNCLREIHENAFRGLSKLNTLDLSNNVALSKGSLVKSLTGGGIVPKLQELYLSNASVLYLDTVQGRDMLSAVKNKPIKVLDISNTNTQWLGWLNLLTGLPFLEKLNISNTSIYMLIDIFSETETSSTNLSTLDVSYIPYAEPLDIYPDWVRIIDLERRLTPLNLTELYAKKLLRNHINVYGTTNSTHLCTTVISDKTNKSINICFEKDVSKTEKLVISENSVTYIEPRIWQGFNGLRYLDISKNDLGFAFSKDDYAVSTLDNLENLEVFILSENNITHIPDDTFRSSKYLKVLDLRKNKLEGITFRTDYLHSLTKLDISHNNIIFLDEISLHKINFIRNPQQMNRSSIAGKVQISLKGNPFVCSCENTQFLYWLLTFNKTYTCKFGSEQKIIDRSFIQRVEYQCKEIIVITVYSILSLVLITLIAVATYFLVKERKRILQRKIINAGIEIYRVKRNEMKIPPVFLSFSSDDDEFVMDEIYPVLDAGLKKILNTETRCVATSYSDFRPGFCLAKEIIRCIEASSVVVFFVTNSFCEKVWCRNETLVAHNTNKHTVIMFWEKVDKTMLPKHLYKHLQECVCVYWVEEDGHRVMKPGWDKLCETVVGLFSNETNLT